jgi:uncharacterized protein (TIRG00374 family)
METAVNKTDSEEPISMRRKIFSLAARFLVSAIVLYIIISLVQWQNIIAAYQSADGRWIALAVLLLLFNIGIRTFKWRTMLRSVKNAPTIAEAFGSVMLGISLGSFTPGEIGEFAGRAVHIVDAKRTHLVGLTLLDKVQISIVTGCAGLVSLACITINNPLLVGALILVIAVLSGVFILCLGRIALLTLRLHFSLFQKSWLKRIVEGFNLLKSKQVCATVMFTLVYYIVLILQMFCLINAFSKISLVHAFVGTSAMMFVKSLLPISIGDLGIREAGSIYFFSFYDISQAAALNASVMLFFINIVIPSIAGIYFIRHQQGSLGKLVQFWKKTKRLAND